MEHYFGGFTKRRLIQMLCALCLHPANAKIVRTLQNKSFKEFIEAIKTFDVKEKQNGL